MAVNVRLLNCTPADVFAVIDNGWLYPAWVVGASRMREVDEYWPTPGTRLHHSFGVWPALIDDVTVVESYERERTIVTRAKGWPIGEARVRIDVKLRAAGALVRIEENAVAGPGRLIPKPIMDILLHWRNAETLQRLAFLAEGRAGGDGLADDSSSSFV